MEDLLATPATLILIAVNVIVSFIGFSNSGFTDRYLFHVGPIRQQRQWDRTITSGFLHGDFFHLAINMYVLFGFGQVIEGLLGTERFLIVYFASLLGGSLWALMENLREPGYRALGASGAVSGCILCVVMFAPTATFYPFGIPMPGLVFGLGFILISAMLAQNKNKVIGHEAHLGGAIAGILATIAVYPQALSIFSSQVAKALGGS